MNLQHEAHERVFGYWLDDVAWHAGYRDTPYQVAVINNRWRIVSQGDSLPDWPLDRILVSGDIVVYPTDLRLPLRRVQAFWYIASDRFPVRLGNAEQTTAYVKGAFDRVSIIAAEDIHGTCALIAGDLIQARSYPSWCGV